MYRVGEQFHTSVYCFHKRIVMIVIIFTESKYTSVILFTLLMKQRNNCDYDYLLYKYYSSKKLVWN